MPGAWSRAVDRCLFATPDWAWLLLALGLRCAFALSLGDRFHQTDEGSFDTVAWRTAASGSWAALQSPVLPQAFFAACYRLFGHRLLWARLGQAFVSAGTAWLLGRMAADLSGSPRTGRWALVFSSLYPFFIYYSGMVLSETLYLAALVPGLWWLCASLQDRGGSLWKPLAAGLALGAAALCRAEAAPIAGLLWLAGLLACLRGRWRWQAGLVAVLAWAIPITAWCARNRTSEGAFGLDFHGGITLLHGTLVFEENEHDTGAAMAALEKLPFYEKTLSLPAPERNRVYLRAGWDFMRAHPGLVARQWARKSVNFWRFYPRADKAYREDVHSHPGAGLSRAALIAVSLACEPGLILGGLWGLWTLRRRWGALFPLPLFLLGTMAVHVVSVSQMRYRLAVMPLLIVGAAVAAARRRDAGPSPSGGPAPLQG